MKQSAGILLYKIQNKQLFVLLVHPGGPFFAKKDEGSWTIPKGELDAGEDALAAAKREFFEETGTEISGPAKPLTAIRQKSGKQVLAWAVEGDLDSTGIKSNLVELEWPPRNGKKQAFLEVDRAEWLNVKEAMLKIIPAQQPFINELEEFLVDGKLISSA